MSSCLAIVVILRLTTSIPTEPAENQTSRLANFVTLRLALSGPAGPAEYNVEGTSP